MERYVPHLVGHREHVYLGLPHSLYIQRRYKEAKAVGRPNDSDRRNDARKLASVEEIFTAREIEVDIFLNGILENGLDDDVSPLRVVANRKHILLGSARTPYCARC